MSAAAAPAAPGGVLELAWRRYLAQLQARPLRTKALTSAALAAASDLLAQSLAGSGPLRYRRTAAVALYGGLVAGPASHFWQAALERLFANKRDPLRRWARVFVRAGGAASPAVERSAARVLKGPASCIACRYGSGPPAMGPPAHSLSPCSSHRPLHAA